ncbi:MAG: hypothetical protein E7232_03495 [Lachnospiraceae bacterium]|jgi:hypothetical protein|nr:hypothetical protein [Lachnospiraceae bacterium]
MKKNFKLLIATLGMACTFAMTSFAGQWLQDTNGWSYLNDNGTKAIGWQWIDGNGDGISECYYFDEYGYCLMNTITPDGLTVDQNGAWIVNGVVQTQNAQIEQNASVQQSSTTTASMYGYSGISSTPYDGYTIIVNTNTHKYHVPGCSKANQIHADNKGYADNAQLLESQGFTACKVCH